jgi:hypothetical protein
MMLLRRLLPAATAAALGASCAGDHPAAARTEAESSRAPRSFDLVPRGYDDNCLALNPQLGWAYNESHDPRARDPAACTWFFYEDKRSRPDRPPCTSYPLDPDLGTDLSTDFEITCSDSPMSFAGHINWGKYYGHAATFEGWLTWEGFSGTWPNDYDLNFNFSAFANKRLGEGLDSIAVELDSREVQNLASPWWRELLRKVHEDKLNVSKHVGVAYAQVTGLLGIDAEHLSGREVDIELHPAFAMALQVACTEDFCTHGVEHWALLARERGNEGLCSHWERKHVLPLAGGAYVFRFPWRRGATGVSVVVHDKDGNDHSPVFCSSGQGEPSVAAAIDASNHAALISISLPPNGIVDGDLYLQWHGPAEHKQQAPALESMPRRGSPELEDPAVAQRHVERLQQNPVEAKAFDEQVASQGATCKAVSFKLAANASLSAKADHVAGRPPDPPMKHVCKEVEALKVAAAVGATVTAPPAPGTAASLAVPAAPAVPAPKSVVQAYCEKRAGKSKEAERFCRSIEKH